MIASVMTVGLFVAVISFVTPEDTHASVGSFFSSLIKGNTANANVNAVSAGSANSQTMTLLEAAVNTNPNPTQTTDLSIVDDSALETPTGPGGTALEVEEKMSNTDKVSVYVVRSGDSLQSIAQMFGVTSNTIMWANDLKSAKDLKLGQELVILPISGVKYVVKKGDTLKSIAAKFKGDAGEIQDFNNMPDTSVSVGDEIIIPDGEVAAAVSVTTKTPSKPAASKTASGYFSRPLRGGIKTQGLHGKYGTAVDLGTPVGTQVYAAAGGKVLVAKTGGYNGGYGNYIVVQHNNGMQTIYAHLSVVDVSAGNTVSQGDPIGKSGNTGNSTGPHLHFEILGTRNWNPFN
ncbi:MAG: peptidase family protein [Candidatus Taylorbacteria bacterium]|nr:peptidase family protein [Candidatus Taylorbacteria bacterium]